MSSSSVYLFGPFRLHVASRLLLNGNQPVGLGSRAFDLLVALLEHAGQVVSPSALISRVWPDTVVESSSLRVHISALRKTLGPAEAGAYVQNIPTRGYSFVAPVRQLPAEAVAAAEPPDAVARPWPEPSRPAAWDAPALVGRAELVRAAADRLRHTRCLSLVGPPGIGKTSVALQVRNLVSREQGLASVLLDLAPLASADNLPGRLAADLGVTPDPRDPVATLARALQQRPLLVLDNCEHLVGAVAVWLEQLLHAADRLVVLVTSREPLRIRGESVMRIPALALPPADGSQDQRAGDYAAVALFLQRAEECNDGQAIQPGDEALVAAICRRLDGVPLAIELAAASTPAFSLRHIAAHLDQRFALLVHGRRTALPRHRTLQAAIAWSYDLLSTDEQQVLQGLSCFSGWFSLAAAAAVCGSGAAASDTAGIHAAIHGLVSKSLLVVGGSTEVDGYRLLESVREFGRDRLLASGRRDELARRHAQQLLAQLTLPESAREQLSRAEWVARHGGQLDDLRAALAWALAEPGDPALAIALSATSAPLWFSLSLMDEFLDHAERALRLLNERAPPADTVDLMRLHTALGLARWHVHGATAQVQEAFAQAGRLAAQAGDLGHQLRSVWGLALACNANADYAGSRQLAARFGELLGEHPPPALAVTHGLMLMLGEHLVGRHQAAQQQAQRVLEARSAVAFVGTSTGTQFDPCVAALAVRARLHWISGRPDSARRSCAAAIERAQALEHAVSLCFAVAVGTAPVAHWCGDLARARHDCALMIELAARHALRFWLGFGETYHAAACVLEGSRPWNAASRLDLARGARSSAMLAHTLCTFADRFAPEALEGLLAATRDSWCAPELLRIQAVRLMDATPDGAARAMAPLQASIALARQQQALAWELRSTRTLATCLDRQGRRPEACDRLAAVTERMVEGRDTADVAGALAQLAAWHKG